jgi:hypothetical protein
LGGPITRHFQMVSVIMRSMVMRMLQRFVGIDPKRYGVGPTLEAIDPRNDRWLPRRYSIGLLGWTVYLPKLFVSQRNRPVAPRVRHQAAMTIKPVGKILGRNDKSGDTGRNLIEHLAQCVVQIYRAQQNDVKLGVNLA